MPWGSSNSNSNSNSNSKSHIHYVPDPWVDRSRNRHIELNRTGFLTIWEHTEHFRGPKTGPFRSRRENELDLVNLELSCSDVRRSRMDTSAQESLWGHPCPAGVI